MRHTPVLAELDLSVPSYRGAYHFAREAALAAARKRGASLPGPQDKPAGDAVMARLLWQVDASEGGFRGLSDAALERRLETMSPRLDPGLVHRSIYDACAPWPWDAERRSA